MAEPQIERVWSPIGAHEYYVEGDMWHWRVHGPVELDDIKPVLDLTYAFAQKHRQAFLVVHMAGVGGFGSEARRYLIDWKRQHPQENRWAIVIGTSTLVRTLTMLVIRGTALLTGQEPTIHLVRDEDEARAVITQIRAAGPHPQG